MEALQIQVHFTAESGLKKMNSDQKKMWRIGTNWGRMSKNSLKQEGKKWSLTVTKSRYQMLQIDLLRKHLKHALFSRPIHQTTLIIHNGMQPVFHNACVVCTSQGKLKLADFLREFCDFSLRREGVHLGSCQLKVWMYWIFSPKISA